MAYSTTHCRRHRRRHRRRHCSRIATSGTLWALVQGFVWVLVCSGLISGCSGGGDGDDATLSDEMIEPNSAPDFAPVSTLSVPSGMETVVQLSATDPDGDVVSFTISGGVDAAQFELAGGTLQFVVPPQFDVPGDADGDNRYEVVVSASDGQTAIERELVIEVVATAVALSVRRIATGFDQPLFVTDTADASNRLFVIEKTGLIRLLDLATGQIDPTPMLDVSASITTDGERGLLGLALAPDFATSGEFYVNVTNLLGDTEIRRYQLSANNSDQADPASEEVILTFAQFASNHNGGWIGFGPDGFLYIASGDGGGAGDPANNGQDSATLLGAMLRIDPNGDDFPADDARDYAIPATNPFANAGGAPEIFAYGLRNPFRASFDRDTGDLYIGDVGQGDIEEIDRIPNGVAGLNFGWNILEGTQAFGSGASTGSVTDLTPPVAEYQHGSGPLQGNSVTGGVVYRGPIEPLRGYYVFGDFVSDNIWSVDTTMFNDGATLAANGFTVLTAELPVDAGGLNGITSFGEDAVGNLYITDIDGEVFVLESQ